MQFKHRVPTLVSGLGTICLIFLRHHLHCRADPTAMQQDIWVDVCMPKKNGGLHDFFKTDSDVISFRQAERLHPAIKDHPRRFQFLC